MGTLNYIRESIKTNSLKLNDLANSEHDIEVFNELFDHIQSMKQLADDLEGQHEQCG